MPLLDAPAEHLVSGLQDFLVLLKVRIERVVWSEMQIGNAPFPVPEPHLDMVVLAFELDFFGQRIQHVLQGVGGNQYVARRMRFA